MSLIELQSKLLRYQSHFEHRSFLLSTHRLQDRSRIEKEHAELRRLIRETESEIRVAKESSHAD